MSDTVSAFELMDPATMMGSSIRQSSVHLDEECPVVNTPLQQLAELFSTIDILVVAVCRDHVLFVPKGSERLQVGDVVLFFGDQENTARVLELFGASVPA